MLQTMITLVEKATDEKPVTIFMEQEMLGDVPEEGTKDPVSRTKCFMWVGWGSL